MEKKSKAIPDYIINYVFITESAFWTMDDKLETN